MQVDEAVGHGKREQTCVCIIVEEMSHTPPPLHTHTHTHTHTCRHTHTCTHAHLFLCFQATMVAVDGQTLGNAAFAFSGGKTFSCIC